MRWLHQHVAPASREGRWIWWGILILMVVLLVWLRELRTPWRTDWYQDLASGKRHTFKTYLRVGLWWGTVAHLVLTGLLLATGRWWGADRKPARFASALGVASKKASRFFWIALMLLVVAAGVVRWPKMSLSYWGDEGWAVAPYVYGKHVPVNPDEPQGTLVHKPVSWENTAFDDRTCGNHYLFSLSQRVTLGLWRWWCGLTDGAFDETVSRLPPFAAGLGSLLALALLLRWLGRPGAGLAAALMLALHPWHVRYSTEARGYTMMLFFLILVVWLALVALRDGRWRWWLAFGAAEFLCMYSWKGVMYPLAAVNGIFLLWIWLGRHVEPGDAAPGSRACTCGRWLVANLLAAGLFVNLVYPCVIQVKDAKEHLIQLSGRPMNEVWLDDSLSAIFTGMNWHAMEPENPTEVALSQTLAAHPWSTGWELAALALLLLAGWLLLARAHPWHAALWSAIVLSGAAGAACFRWLIHAEWISWYFFFETLPFAVMAGLALDELRRLAVRSAASGPKQPLILKQAGAGWVAALLLLALPAAYAHLTWPEVGLMRHQAFEDHRGAFESTRGRHEPLHQTAPSRVYTVYLWRYISLYDPRGDTHVRRAAELRELIEQVERENAELYVVVGHRRMARLVSSGIMAMVQDSALFEHLRTYWAPEELHNLHCYHYLRRKSALPAPP